jgi:trypsin
MAAALPLEEGSVGISIVGGTTATIGEFPFIVSLTDGSSFCGGVLINANTVLTAGHCADVRASSLRVRAGSAVSH